MEVRWSIVLIILGASVVTVLPRVIPLLVLSRLQIPDWAMRWLRHVPIAVMAALVAQELLTEDGALPRLQDNPELFAALPTFLVALLTRSLLWTVVAGVVSMMLLRLWW